MRLIHLSNESRKEKMDSMNRLINTYRQRLTAMKWIYLQLFEE